MSDFVVPDMIEPIVAWRGWAAQYGVNHDRILSFNGSVWEPKERMEARCVKSEPTIMTTPCWEAYNWLRDDRVTLRDLTDDEYRLYAPRAAIGCVVAHAVSMSSVGVSLNSIGVTGSTGPFGPVMHTEPAAELEEPGVILPPMWYYRVGTRETVYPPMHTECPGEHCTCGIYALDSRKAVEQSYSSHLNVIGEVYLWGKVVEGERGYRAQYAYPKNFEVRSGHVNEEMLAQYGVPVERPALKVAISTALPRSGRGRSIALGINLAVIPLILTGFALGVMKWWNVAFLAVNATVALVISPRLRRIVLSVPVIVGLIVFVTITLPITLVMMVTAVLVDLILDDVTSSDWWFDHCPFAAAEKVMDWMDW